MFNRTLVAIKPFGEKSFAAAKFAECLVHHFQPNVALLTPVKCKLEDNILKLSEADPNSVGPSSGITWDQKRRKFVSSDSESFVVLQHSPACPIANLTEEDIKLMPVDIQERGIDVAVSVIVESRDNRILMTQRAAHMRTFPRAWVPPGGHIEEGESLVDAGLRELKEETGLILGVDSCIRILCLWESVYPVLLGLGSPVRHHLVVYLLAKVNNTSLQLQSQIKLDPEEVQAYSWLSMESVRYLLAGGAPTGYSHPFQNMLALQPDGSLKEEPLELGRMYHPSLWGRGQVYSGSQLALSCWIKSLNAEQCKM